MLNMSCGFCGFKVSGVEIVVFGIIHRNAVYEEISKRFK